MLLIGENINVMSKKIGPAIKNKDAGPIQELARKEKEAGMDYLDINLGPARKNGPETMEWLVKTVQDAAGLPLFLDTANVEAIEAGLKVHKGKAVINSISCRPERMAALFPLVKKYNAGFVGLLYGVEGIPRDGAERGMLAADLLAKAAENGIPAEDVWIDPVVVPVSSQQDQVKGCTEFMTMFRELAPGCSSTCGLSNVSNGSPENLRPLLNQTYLMMLEEYGMASAIVDAFDVQLAKTAKGGTENRKTIIRDVLAGNEPADVPPEDADYVKTAKVLLGRSLYSHSWLRL